MSDTPESRAVAEAREQMRRALYLSPASGGTMETDDVAIAAFEENVRAEERARVKALVAGMRGYPAAFEYSTGTSIGATGAPNEPLVGRTREESFVDRTALLAAIDGRE